MKVTLTITVAALTAILTSCEKSSIAQPAAAAPPANEVWITPQQMRASAIETAPVGSRPVGNTLVATGRVTFSDARVAHVFSPVTGRITKVAASLGQTVRRGDALAMIESPDLASAVADKEKADADFTAAQRDYERQKELYEAHAAAQRDYEAAEDNFRRARAERDRAAQKAAMLGSGSAYVLRAPMDGEIVARTATLGSEVQGQYANGTSPELFTLGNLDRVWVMADVYEVDLPRIRTGSPATIHVVSYPDRDFTGTVDWIAGALDPATRTAKVRCTIDNTSHLLRPEMFATVSLTTEAKPRLAVPRAALLRVGEEMVTFVDKGTAPDGHRRFERRVVVIDDAHASDVVPIVSGLRPGEIVVTSGAIILTGSAS